MASHGGGRMKQPWAAGSSSRSRTRGKTSPTALESVRWSDDVHVVDSQSTDGTAEVDDSLMGWAKWRVSPGNIVRDIDAYVVRFSLIAGNMVGSSGQVVAIEPSLI